MPKSPMPGGMALGALLEQELSLQNLSRPSAAAAMKISSSTLNRLLNPKSAAPPVSRLTWERVSAWLGVTAESLRRRCFAVDIGVPVPPLVPR